MLWTHLIGDLMAVRVVSSDGLCTHRKHPLVPSAEIKIKLSST